MNHLTNPLLLTITFWAWILVGGLGDAHPTR